MSNKDLPFDLNEAIEHIKAGKPLNGKDGLLTPLIKQITEAALKAEQEQHLAEDLSPNRKNGYSKKTVKAASGSFELDTPRDRAGTFEPQIVKKHQTQLTDDLERKILTLYAHGNSYQSIREHLKDYYDIEFSNGTLNTVTDKLLPELQSWRERDLDPVYPIVWLDAIHYKIKENGRYVSKAIYTILALTIEGKRNSLAFTFLTPKVRITGWVYSQTCKIEGSKIFSSHASMAWKAFLKPLRRFTLIPKCNYVSFTKFATR